MSSGSHDTFPVRFPNIFVDYPLGQMHVRDKLWINWNKAPLKLWQTQLNYVVFCASSACGVSSAHLRAVGTAAATALFGLSVFLFTENPLKCFIL